MAEAAGTEEPGQLVSLEQHGVNLRLPRGALSLQHTESLLIIETAG